VALDPRDSAAYRVAFRALAAGSKIERAIAPLSVGDVVIPAGAFLLRGPTRSELAAEHSIRSYPLDTRPEGSHLSLAPPRVALVETWFHDMDAGWTRYLLERSNIPYTLLRPGDVADADLADRFDVVLFPDADKEVLTEGKLKWGGEYRFSDYRPEYRKGLSNAGMKSIHAFLEAGGRVVSWGRSTELFFGPLTYGEGDDSLELEVPVRDDAERLDDEGFYVPGSLLAVDVLADHPLTWGMPAATGVFSRGRPVLGTSLPMLVTDRRVIARFPEERDIMLSGYAEEVQLLEGRPALVWARAGRGQMVFFGFQPQFRASTPVTYKLLYNALLLPELTFADAGVPIGD
jgi:hypothetical protein